MAKKKGKGGKNESEYARVLRMLGNGRCEAQCYDYVTRLCHIRGTMHKKVWIAPDDIILVGLRDFQDDKADVILKYTPDEARLLTGSGKLPGPPKDIIGTFDDEDEFSDDEYFEFADEDIDNI